jgi:hypothetical protein
VFPPAVPRIEESEELPQPADPSINQSSTGGEIVDILLQPTVPEGEISENWMQTSRNVDISTTSASTDLELLDANGCNGCNQEIQETIPPAEPPILKVGDSIVIQGLTGKVIQVDLNWSEPYQVETEEFIRWVAASDLEKVDFAPQQARTPKIGDRLRYGNFTGVLASFASDGNWFIQWDKISNSYKKLQEKMNQPLPELPLKLKQEAFEVIG